MSTQLTTLTNKLAAHFDMGDGTGLLSTLKNTAFKGNVTDDQMTALLIVANQYKLNPWTKEIYAFPDRGGIVPIVGVDGWARIINSDKNFDGIEFEQDNEKCTCKIYRKDRNHPIIVTEYLDECKRNTDPWKTHPRRMLRHKAMIQCARLAFGFAGIYDQDEAERIRDAEHHIKDGDANPFTGDTTNPDRDALIVAAEQVAKQGNVDALREHLQSLTRQERAIIGTDEMKRLAEIAQQAEIIDAEFTEVPREEVPM